jgi:hypothetical protein
MSATAQEEGLGAREHVCSRRRVSTCGETGSRGWQSVSPPLTCLVGVRKSVFAYVACCVFGRGQDETCETVLKQLWSREWCCGLRLVSARPAAVAADRGD